MMRVSAQEIARALHLKGGRGDCPICGGVGALSLRTGRGGTLDLKCFYIGCSPRDLREKIGRIAGGDVSHLPVRDPGLERGRGDKHQRSLRLWSAAKSASGSPATPYFERRALPGLELSAALRFGSDVPHPSGGRYPAVLALIKNADGLPAALHRTYLSEDGHKANVSPNKASLGPIWGCAIRLDPESPELVIGEGIETSASAGRLLGLPAWAAISAGNLGRGLVLPSAVRSVVIAVDRDFAGEQAARQAAERWTAEGRIVRIAVPNIGNDFNDVLRARREAADAP